MLVRTEDFTLVRCAPQEIAAKGDKPAISYMTFAGIDSDGVIWDGTVDKQSAKELENFEMVKGTAYFTVTKEKYEGKEKLKLRLVSFE